MMWHCRAKACVKTKGELADGDVVEVVSKLGVRNCQGAGDYTYYKVKYDDKYGFVAGELLDCEDVAAPAPAPAD